MKFKFTIGKRIGTGFGVLILLVITVFTITYNTLDRSININDKITTVNNGIFYQKSSTANSVYALMT